MATSSRYFATPHGETHARLGGDPARPGLLLIPGSPSTWRDMAVLLRQPALRSAFHLAAVDRPGYGQSTPGVPEPSLQRQAERLLPVVAHLAQAGRTWVLGHSYGGPVALWLAVHYPDLVAGATLLHPVVDPSTTTFQWLRNTGQVFWPVLPGLLKVSTIEMNALPSGLAAMAREAHRLQVPVDFVQGMRDFLAPPPHADFAERVYPAPYMAVERLPKGSHFTPFIQPTWVVDRVLAAAKANGTPI